MSEKQVDEHIELEILMFIMTMTWMSGIKEIELCV